MLVRTNFLWSGELFANFLVVLTTVASLLYLLPYWAHADYASIDFGIYLIIGFSALWFLLTFTWSWQKLQQRIITMISHRDNALASWLYDQHTWHEYAQSECRRTYRQLVQWYVIFLLMGVFIGIPWSQMFGQISLIHLLLVVSVGLLVTFVRVTLVPYYRVLNTAPEAFISTEGICIGGTVYFWEQANSNFWQHGGIKIRSLTLVQGQPNTLEFKLYLRNGRSSSSPVVRVPIPAGFESQAKQAMAKLAPIN